jgi:hypothetical protein
MIVATLALLAQQEVVLYEDERDLGRLVPSVSVFGRVSFPSGTLSPGDVRYSDNFEAGFGLGVELDLLRVVAPGYRIGGYLSAAWDSYDGDEFSDPFGTSVEPDTMDLATFFAGVKTLFWPGPEFRVEGRLGFGAAHYGAVEADVVDQGFPLGKIDFFEETWKPAFELGGRFGWGIPQIAFGLGLSFRVQGGPDEADASDVLLDTGALWLFTIDVGLTLRF